MEHCRVESATLNPTDSGLAGIEPSTLFDDLYARGAETCGRIWRATEGLSSLVDGDDSNIDVPGYMYCHFSPESRRRAPGLVERERREAAINWVADSDGAEHLFGRHDRLYTVTSSLALEAALSHMRGSHNSAFTPVSLDFQPDAVLFPLTHANALNLPTHRGMGTALFTELMYQLGGDDLGRTRTSVWLGRQIDGQQVDIEQSIAEQGTLADEELFRMCFVSDCYKQYLTKRVFREGLWNQFSLHPMLRQVIEGQLEGQSAYEQSADCRRYVDGLLDVIATDVGIRSGWYTKLAGLLKGTIAASPLPSASIADIESSIVEAAKAEPLIPHRSQAIIMEVDAEKLLSLHPLYPFPLTARPVSEIVPAPYVTLSAVTAIYAHDPSDPVLKPFENDAVRILPFGSVPTGKWLTDAWGEPVLPGNSTRGNHDPANPLCTFRYKVGEPNPEVAMAGHILAGDIAPMAVSIGQQTPKSIRGPYVSPDLSGGSQRMLDVVMRRLVLDEAERLGFAMAQRGHDRAAWERRVVSEAGRTALLPALLPWKNPEQSQQNFLARLNHRA